MKIRDFYESCTFVDVMHVLLINSKTQMGIKSVFKLSFNRQQTNI